MSITRRVFLKASAAVAVPIFVSSKVFGANETINIGVIGLGIRGTQSHVPEFSKLSGVRVTALADPDKTRTASTLKTMQEKGLNHQIDQYEDMRRVFDRTDIHAVSIATMNHWHALATIWACQAGKHVYVEKPLSHFIWEGRQMVNAAKKYNRIVQHGTQLRSCPSIVEAIKWTKAGNLGKILYVTAFANKVRQSIGKRQEPLPLPNDFNYDLWCGPAQADPIYRNKIQYDCSFTWNMGDGESLNQGVHQIDVARWLLGIEGMPKRTLSMGGRFLFNDAGDVPNTQIIYYDYPDVPILYSTYNLSESKNSKKAENFRFTSVGITIDCENGWVGISHSPYCVAYDKNDKIIQKWSTGGDHFQNFVNAVRNGNNNDLASDVLCGHLSTRIGHAGNISYRLGERANVSEQKKVVADYPYFAEMHERYLKHLAAHEIDPNETILGRWLECDTENECFVGNDDAYKFARGSYRKPYLIPNL